MKKKVLHFFGVEDKFKREFKKQMRTFIIIALGFTIAFTWRQTIFDVSTAFVRFVTDIKDSSALSILSSLFITLISILLIYLAARFLKDDYY